MCWWLATSTLPALPSPRLEQACSGQRGCASSPQYHLPTGCIMNSLSLLLPGPPSGSFSDWKGLLLHRQQSLETALTALFRIAGQALATGEAACGSTPPGLHGMRLRAQRQPLASLFARRAGLSVFRTNPAVPLKNVPERILRGPAIACLTGCGWGSPLCVSWLPLHWPASTPYAWLLDYLSACAAQPRPCWNRGCRAAWTRAVARHARASAAVCRASHGYQGR